MSVRLKNLLPFPLRETDTSSSQIWKVDEVIFHPGERILLYAGSGKGKTTLLSLIYGLRKDYEGSVSLDSRDISMFSDYDISILRKEEISYIFQGLELFDELTALENIQIKNRQRDYKSEGEIQQLAYALDIHKLMNHKCGILSFGQRQRVAIIRALCQPFHLLLADEIFSHMDKNIQAVGMEIIANELKIHKAGMLFTSLDPGKNSFFHKSYRI